MRPPWIGRRHLWQGAGMGEIVNLRKMRRQRDRDQASQQAADNRARFGRTRTEVERDRQGQARQQAVLDGARLDAPPPAREPPTAG